MSVSDSGGVGSDAGRVQNAMMVLATPAGEVKYGVDLPAVPLSWRSSRCRRVVISTLAGETQAAVSATTEVEWLQTVLRVVMVGDIQTLDWQSKLSPFMHVQSCQCTLAERLGHQHVVDAKSLYDALSKESAGGRTDRRTAVDMNFLREAFHRTGAVIRWVPHYLVVDSMTTGRLLLTSEDRERGAARGVDRHNRSKAASRRRIAQGMALASSAV